MGFPFAINSPTLTSQPLLLTYIFRVGTTISSVQHWSGGLVYPSLPLMHLSLSFAARTLADGPLRATGYKDKTPIMIELGASMPCLAGVFIPYYWPWSGNCRIQARKHVVLSFLHNVI